jgi:myo-inositol 2-dehydrogenase / D-chiro-inositol 1-dehydrogenase
VRVGLIGSGNRGSHVAEALANNTPARITALCDIVDDRLHRAGSRLKVSQQEFHKDYRQLLESGVDAVIIATPVHLHAEHFEAAVKAGKHIYIEKPASIDVAGCRRIMRAADSADRRLNITFGFQRRYAHLYRKARKLVESGAAGEINLALARFIKSEGAAAQAAQFAKPANEAEALTRWHAWQKYSGDLIVENNVHSIDVLNWFLGGHPVSAIGAGGVRRPSGGDMRDHNFVAYTYAGELRAQLTGTTVASTGYREVLEQFYGSKAMVETSENHLKVFYTRDNQTFEKPQHNMTVEAVQEFVQRIVEKRPENTAISGAESTLTAILGRMAMELRREITWDEMMKS